MRGIIKGKWFILLAWIAVVAVLLVTAPNMADLVREKGELTVPDSYSSAKADQIMKEISNGDESQVALIFHSDKKLTGERLDEVKMAIDELEANKAELGITEITTHLKEKGLEEQLVSKDEKSILTAVTVELGDRSAKAETELLYKALKDIKVDHYYTSSWMIGEDLNTNAQEGLKKTEGITVVFILAVLLLVFRSIVAPFIPLITVGFTYLASQSVVSFLVDKVNFPISSYTQIFLVAVLFGLGTDYCILLLSRFKEEFSRHESLTDAIVETYRTAGKTVLFSAIAVMIGFSAIGLSTFNLYQSAAAVAVGVAILLVAIATIVPFFMSVLGKKIFWPSKGQLEHKESKLWGTIGSFALARPIITLLIVAGVTVPFLVTYDGIRSYNALEEAGDNAPSINAFNLIADSFGPGQSMTTKIVIKNDDAMDNSEYIGLAEKISGELEKIDEVDQVRSATRPMGEPIEDLFVSKQAETLGDGLGDGNEGIKKISNGLHQAGSEMSKSAPKLKTATNGISELITGTSKLQSGMTELQKGLSQIEAGIRKGSMGSGEAKKGLEEIRANAVKLQAGSVQLLNGYQGVASGLTTIEKNYENVANGLSSLSKGLSNVNQLFPSLENDSRYEGLASDERYLTIKGSVQQAQATTAQLSAGLKQLNTSLSGAANGVKTANQSFKKITDGQKALNNGMSTLITGLDQLEKGMTAAADGQAQAIEKLPQVSGGLSSINDGQQQLLDGFSSLGGQISDLTNGLNQSAEGLDKVHNGLGTAQDYLMELSSTESSLTGMYIPDEVLSSEDFSKVLDTYMSENRKVMTLDVVFKENPYSNEAIDTIPEIKSTIKQATKGTKLENATIAVGGTTSTYADLRSVSDDDYSRTVFFMLTGIGIILFFLLRSLVMPIYLLLSLILTYYTSMSITELIFVNGLGYTGIGWAVPFFAFVILIALGIDYSIFLMDRFNEYKQLSVKEAMLLSMKKMGTVIISAAIILGGTFAAMMPSGVLSLLEIATIVLVGLFLYGMIILPLFIPVMAKLFGRANWWPFINKNINK
ncbi:MMPL family transporter [Bacillus massilinigeriensis]|uniref:MMPL family transporter n=1 Tax=Bacillus massilionigeriensis TaxID=1805475 RepID=UPI00096B300A|nr:MMPL family transporter [Bacillus massilionigeriensis]